MLMAMEIIYISEADAVRDFAAVLAHVRAGSEVVIEGESAPVAVLIPPTDADPIPRPRPIRSMTHGFAPRCRRRSTIHGPVSQDEEVEAEFAQRRAATLRTIKSSAE